uniref:Olfactory receptor 1052-like n=1 Tax=Geotrypetes seraphini TaxID=260995 RepID=A0A6P8P093_GEOSA|nr:olfactory receptor 1052-like [Geotrypetes seraphini]
MEGENKTFITEIILLGFSDLPKLQNLLFTTFLAMYALTLLGNIGIILLIRIDPQLHTPMYLFLSNLSFVDICYSSTVTPRALANFIMENQSISLSGCATQFYFIAMLASAECFLLSVMAYDRYMAICNPLLYTAVMTKKVCIQLLGNAYVISLTYSLIQTGNIFSIPVKSKNQTSVTEFILLGFSDLPKLQILLFIVFLVMYILTLLGNISIVTIIRMDPHLHTPMYYFLTNLAFVDLCYSSTIAPKALVDFKVEKNTISLFECATQLFMFVNMGSVECYLLAVMAYDRYVAICNPLLYTAVMNRRVCTLLVLGVYTVITIYALMQTINIFSVNFCGSNEIDHFYCDAHPLLKLSCSDTSFNEIVLSTLSGIFGFLAVIPIVLSYILIISAILRIRSSEGRRKAFSTCASHFSTVILFFGTIIFIYVIPSSYFSLYTNRALSVIYTMVIPMVNPMIYSLRNKDVTQALRKIFQKK